MNIFSLSLFIIRKTDYLFNKPTLSPECLGLLCSKVWRTNEWFWKQVLLKIFAQKKQKQIFAYLTYIR